MNLTISDQLVNFLLKSLDFNQAGTTLYATAPNQFSSLLQ